MNDNLTTSSYLNELESWRKTLDIGLMKEDGWLALAGLYWLQEGENSFGTDPGNDFTLDVSTGPERIGLFTLRQGEVTVQILDDVAIQIDGEQRSTAVLQPDSSGSPTVVKLDHLTFMLLEREDGLAIRLWDNQRPERLDFGGRRWLPVNPDFRVHGHYHPYPEEIELSFSRKNGADFQTGVQGEVSFDLEGNSYSLVVFEQKDGSLFIIFDDQTSGKETYPAGRYLVTDPPQDGEVEIDFNRAYHPPCAFTDFATCPLPPAQNRISAAILAGERS